MNIRLSVERVISSPFACISADAPCLLFFLSLSPLSLRLPRYLLSSHFLLLLLFLFLFPLSNFRLLLYSDSPPTREIMTLSCRRGSQEKIKKERKKNIENERKKGVKQKGKIGKHHKSQENKTTSEGDFEARRKC